METLTITPVQQGTLNAQLAMYDLHTRLYGNVLEGLTDKDAHNRLGTKANHPAWLAGSLVHERFEIANILGVEKKDQANELFKDYAGIKDDVTYPSLASYIEDWNMISPLLRARTGQRHHGPAERPRSVRDERRHEAAGRTYFLPGP